MCARVCSCAFDFVCFVYGCAETQAKVSELNLHNNYRLRMKDLNYAEKIKEVR